MAKKLILILFALALLGGGGVAAYVFLAPRPTEAAAAAPAAPEHPGAFVQLNPVTLPVMRNGVVGRMVTFGVTIELAPGRDPAEVWPNLPRIEDALVTELQALLAIDWPGDEAVDIAYARRMLLARFDRVMGAGFVKKLLFRGVREHRVWGGRPNS